MLLLFPVLLLGYLLLGLAVSIGVARWSGRRFRSRIAPWVVFPVLFALFFGDEIYGYWHWQHLCKTEGGLHVYKRVPVEGVWYKGGSGDFGANWLLERGYKYVEGTYSEDYDEKAGRMYRYTLSDSGQVNREPIEQPQSTYVYDDIFPKPFPYYVWANESYIKDNRTGDLLGVVRGLSYQGATVVRYFRSVTGADGPGSTETCGENNPVQLFAKTIPPVESTGNNRGQTTVSSHRSSDMNTRRRPCRVAPACRYLMSRSTSSNAAITGRPASSPTKITAFIWTGYPSTLTKQVAAFMPMY
jgi:hypothetical protein